MVSWLLSWACLLEIGCNSRWWAQCRHICNKHDNKYGKHGRFGTCECAIGCQQFISEIQLISWHSPYVQLTKNWNKCM